MSQITLEGICKVYGKDFEAVKNVNLKIKDSEFMVIVGPSGCGKTTILRMIAGLEQITAGTITIGDRIINDVEPKDRDLAMVFQNYALYPHMSVYGNMAFGLKLRKYPKQEINKRVNEAAAMLGIETQLQKKPKQLSGGQCQRVALGRAVVRNPAAFLFDEPLSNLDAKLRVSTRAELKALHRRMNTTSVYVTHDQAEAMTLGDRICVMYEGEIQQVAEPMQLYNKPLNKFVAGFLGTPPMNFINGRVHNYENKHFFVYGKEKIEFPQKHFYKINDYVGKEVTLGIRPEHFYLDQMEGNSFDYITANVHVVEPLGDRMDVYFKTSLGEQVIANLSPEFNLTQGDEVKLKMKTEMMHVYESGENGSNIILNDFEKNLTKR